MKNDKATARIQETAHIQKTLAELRQRLATVYGRAFPHLTCAKCMHNALDDEYAGQITDDEELDELHMQRREKMRQRHWEQRLLARNPVPRIKKR